MRNFIMLTNYGMLNLAAIPERKDDRNTCIFYSQFNCAEGKQITETIQSMKINSSIMKYG